MKKFWVVYGIKNDGKLEQYETYEAAELAAKHKAHNNRDSDYWIMEAVAIAKQPVPPIEVTRLS